MKNQLSRLATKLTSLSISKLSEKVEERRAKGETIFNFTLGDFAPKHFPIPTKLKAEIIKAYQEKHTNYSFVGGILELRKAIAQHIKLHGQFNYKPEEIIVASGARPLIYLLFRTLVDPKEKIIYTAPSWNTEYFIYLTGAVPIRIRTEAKNNFLPKASELKPHLKNAVLISFNSPANPSGTMFDQKTLKEILDLIVIENRARAHKKQKPLYIFFDIIYWLLIYNGSSYKNPTLLNKEIKDYTIFVDGISKCFAATGVRVGWAFGAQMIIEKMRSMLSHIGAWAPKPEQVGTAKFLNDNRAVTSFLASFKKELLARLNIFYTIIQKLKTDGYPVDAISPQGALYLSIKLDLIGLKARNNRRLINVDEILTLLIKDSGIALVPFHLFGMPKNLPWFRLSVGTCSISEAKLAAERLRQLVISLKK